MGSNPVAGSVDSQPLTTFDAIQRDYADGHFVAILFGERLLNPQLSRAPDAWEFCGGRWRF